MSRLQHLEEPQNTLETLQVHSIRIGQPITQSANRAVIASLEYINVTIAVGEDALVAVEEDIVNVLALVGIDRIPRSRGGPLSRI